MAFKKRLHRYNIFLSFGSPLLICIVFVFCHGFFQAYAQESTSVITIEESIAIALKQSAAVDSAKQEVRAAIAAKQEAYTGFLPKFSTSYGYTRLNDEPTFTFSGVPPLIPPSTMATGTEDNYTWAFEVRQPVFAGGAILENYRASEISEEATKIEERVRVLDVVKEVKVAYLNVIKARRTLDVARQSLKQLEAHRSTAQGFYDVHMIPQNDLLRAEVELINGQKNLLKAENAVEIAKANFNILLRRDINADFEIEDQLEKFAFDKQIEECLKIALLNRPEIKVYEMRKKYMEKMKLVAESDYYPTVNLIGHFERFGDGPDVSGSPYKDDKSWYVGGAINWNFFEWGKTKYRVEASNARVTQMDNSIKLIHDQVILEVKVAWHELKEAEKQIEADETAVKQAEENYRISSERYQERLSTSTDVLDAQSLLTRAQSGYVNSLCDSHISFARLERALGAEEEQERGEF